MANYFDVVDSKLCEANGHLQEMSKVLIHPMHRPGFTGGYCTALYSCGTMMDHLWHDAFNSALKAFLFSTRSVPDIISKRCGYDEYGDGKKWLRSLDSNEQGRRKQFHDQFESSFKPFRDHPLSIERKEVAHRSGEAHWEVVVHGSWGTYTGGPLKRLPQTEYKKLAPSEDPPPSWLPGAWTREFQVRWTNFWWVIPQNGAPSLRLPLFEECKKFLDGAVALAERGKTLFGEIHEGQPFTLPPW